MPPLPNMMENDPSPMGSQLEFEAISEPGRADGESSAGVWGRGADSWEGGGGEGNPSQKD